MTTKPPGRPRRLPPRPPSWAGRGGAATPPPVLPGRSLGALLLLAVLVAGCIDPVSLEIEGEGDRLVVEASVAEGPGPHLVQLSYVAAFERGIDALEEPVTGARVTVTRDDGAAFAVVGRGLGAYTTERGALVGEVGRSYALRVELPDGRVFESTPETMRPAPPLVRAYTDFLRDTVLVGTTLAQRPAVVLFAEAANPPDEANYYRWMWTGEFMTFVQSRPNESPFPTLQPCYIRRRGGFVEVSDDRLTTSATLPRRRIETFPFYGTGMDFYGGYAITVEQQALTDDAYSFWSRVRDTRDRAGGLFDPPPSAIVGNVANVDDELDYALGYFTVAGASRKELCTRLLDFNNRPPFSPPRPRWGRCEDLGGSPTPSPAYDVCVAP